MYFCEKFVVFVVSRFPGVLAGGHLYIGGTKDVFYKTLFIFIYIIKKGNCVTQTPPKRLTILTTNFCSEPKRCKFFCFWAIFSQIGKAIFYQKKLHGITIHHNFAAEKLSTSLSKVRMMSLLSLSTFLLLTNRFVKPD